jgi:inner membrane protein
VPSIFSHPAVPLALTAALGSSRVPPRLAVVACVASVVPDLDSLGFMAGIPYGHSLGHRGFTHSISFALLLASLCGAFARHLGARTAVVFAVVFLSAVSHGLLDAMTTGGLGVAFFSPFSNARYFLSWRVILVSPIGVLPFLSERGLAVLKSEWIRIWVPCGLVAGFGASIRWIARTR